MLLMCEGVLRSLSLSCLHSFFIRFHLLCTNIIFFLKKIKGVDQTIYSYHTFRFFLCVILNKKEMKRMKFWESELSVNVYCWQVWNSTIPVYDDALTLRYGFGFSFWFLFLSFLNWLFCSAERLLSKQLFVWHLKIKDVIYILLKISGILI